MIGTRINHRYRIDSELGQGGMGTVYRGFDTTLKRDVAIKIMNEHQLGSEGSERLLREAQAIARLSHPNIVTVHDAGEYEQSPFIVMEYIEGTNLYNQPPADIEEIVAVTKQVCAALSHAHAHGIIHRDLKPENVILTADGTAKLMDFGLARSIRSRLTSEGTIQGTVFYLAPEQAQGKSIDPRSDLYSLGVMLYELTTGELPFMADDPLAVISQHIHAPVVPPRVKNDQIPPALEALMLELMEKDPAARPSSAKEVLEQLSAPEILDVTALPGEELSILDRIVRGRMVGREQELRQVRQAWGQVMCGQGQLLLISGEPGVGKTRLMREIATHAEVGGGQAFIGESQAEGNAPYAAFAQIIRRALRVYQNNGLELPNLVMAELISIAPEMQVDYPDIPPNPDIEPESEQRRLFECILRFFSAVCAEKPLLLVLEDIQWSDSGTLALLQFLARRCREHPVMLLGTYREVELNATLPFHQTLLDLKRKSLGTQIKLQRLDEDKTRDMLAVIFAEEITPDFLEGIYTVTEGNPFFIEEVCKALVESGQVYFDGERWQRPPDMAEMEIPQSIKVAVQSRVSKMSQSAQEIIHSAAVIGREFDFELLLKVTGQEEDDLIEELEAALKAQLIEELKEGEGERFSFSHALIPATLRESLSGMRRTRLHRKVAQVMEEFRPDAYQRLAYHWGESGDLEKEVDYTIKAAEWAKKTYANEDAIRLYREALAFFAEDDENRFDLLKATAEIFNLLGNREAQRDEIEAMLTLVEKLGDEIKQVDALHALVELNLQTDIYKALEPAERAYEISRKISDHPKQARSKLLIGRYYYHCSDYQKAISHYKEAIRIARKAGLKRELVVYYRFLGASEHNLGRREAATVSAREAVALSKELNDPRSIMIGARELAAAHYAVRNYAEGLRVIQTAMRLAQEIGDLEQEFDVRNLMAIILMDLGRWEEAKSVYLKLIEEFDLFSFYKVTFAVNNLSKVSQVLGDYENYHNIVGNLLKKARQIRNEHMEFLLTTHYAASCSWLGEYQEGLKVREKIWPYVDNLNDRIAKVVALYSLSISAGLAGELNKAAQFLAKSQIVSEELEDSTFKAEVWIISACISHLYGTPFAFKEGLEQIDRGIEILLRLGPMDDWFPYCMKACLHLALLNENRTHANEAFVALEKALKVFNEYPGAWGRPETLYYPASQVYRANNQPDEADKYLRKAFDRVLLVAGKIQDDELRNSFLENVKDNQEILKEAEARGWVAE